MEDNKYYSPDISEFYKGFEFQYAKGFMDGTIKSQEEFDDAQWINAKTTIGELPYIERALIGINSQNGKCGIRVKYLDREDIQSLGFEHDQTTKDGAYFYNGHLMTTKEFMLCCPNARLSKGEDYTALSIKSLRDHITDEFSGTVKNKSELKRLMKQLRIE